MKLVYFAVLDLAAGYWFEFGPNWMTCYTDGVYDAASTAKGCAAAGFKLTGRACWAQYVSPGLTGADITFCRDYAPYYCPKSTGIYYKCQSEEITTRLILNITTQERTAFTRLCNMLIKGDGDLIWCQEAGRKGM